MSNYLIFIRNLVLIKSNKRKYLIFENVDFNFTFYFISQPNAI